MDGGCSGGQGMWLGSPPRSPPPRPTTKNATQTQINTQRKTTTPDSKCQLQPRQTTLSNPSRLHTTTFRTSTPTRPTHCSPTPDPVHPIRAHPTQAKTTLKLVWAVGAGSHLAFLSWASGIMARAWGRSKQSFCGGCVGRVQMTEGLSGND